MSPGAFGPRLCRMVILMMIGLGLLSTRAAGQRQPTRGAAVRDGKTLASSPDTLAKQMARAGYVAIPLGRTTISRRTHGEFLYVDAMIGTTPIRLMIDSGNFADLVLGSPLQDSLTGQQANIEGARGGRWTFLTGARIASFELGTVSAYFLDLAALNDALPGPGDKGLLGAPLLARYRAFIDYATDTLYLLPPPAISPELAVHSPAAAAPNLLAALKAAGQYRTFLALMRTAGLTSLLTEIATPGTDTLLWLAARAPAIALGLKDDDADEGDMDLQERLSERFGRPGQLTAFVPTDAAFAQLPPGMLDSLRADTVRLASMLRAHLLIGARLDTAAMRTMIGGVARASGGPAFGFQPWGATTEVDRVDHEGRLVARARIVAPDLAARNGVSHGIDRLLLPEPEPFPIATVMAQQGYAAVPTYRASPGFLIDEGQSGGWHWPLVRATVDTASAPQLLLLDTGYGEEGEIGLNSLVSQRQVELRLDTIAVGQTRATPHLGPFDGIVCIPFLTKRQARLDFATETLYLHPGHE